MGRRDEWQKVLESEVRRWSALSDRRLAAELRESQAYEVEFEGKSYQVEVELLEDTVEYLHVMVAVDDGSLPQSMLPACSTFICRKAADPA